MRISDWSSDVCSSDLEKGIDLVGKFRAVLGTSPQDGGRQDPGDQHGKRDPDGRSQSLFAQGPAAESLHDVERAGTDRVAIEEACEVVGQGEGGAIAL